MPDATSLLSDRVLASELNRQTRQLLPLLAVIAGATFLAALTNFGGFSSKLLLSSFAKHSAFAAFLAVIYILVLRAKPSDMAAMVVLFSIIHIAYSFALLSRAMVGTAVWLACLVAILPEVWRSRNYGLSRIYFISCATLLLPIASTLALVGQQLTLIHASTFDVSAYLVDNSYGAPAAAILGRIAEPHSATHWLLMTVYCWLPPAVSTCYVLNLRAGNRDAVVLLKAALVAGAIAFGLYHIYPAAGPAYAFGSAFPDSLPSPASLAPSPATLAIPGAPRNCMPSVHFAWAILAAIEARRLGRTAHATFVLFAVLTACATLALGEHYLIDLVVAVPFALCIHALFARERFGLFGWCGTAISAGLMTLGWLLFLRIWIPPPHVSRAVWVMTAITLGGSALLWPRTCRQAGRRRAYIRMPSSLAPEQHRNSSR